MLRIILATCLALSSSTVAALNEPQLAPRQAPANATPPAPAPLPTARVILRWLRTGEAVEIGESFPVRLKGGEHAYLVNVSFPQRGRNMESGSLLVRPALAAARELDLGNIEKVIDLGADSATGIVAIRSASGQGRVDGSNVLATLNGWAPEVLLQTDWAGNTGECGEGSFNPVCLDESVTWTFERDEEQLFLVERLDKSSGTDSDNLLTETTTQRYVVDATRAEKLEPSPPAAAAETLPEAEPATPASATDP